MTSTDRPESGYLNRLLYQHLTSLQAAGVEQIPHVEAAPTAAESPPAPAKSASPAAAPAEAAAEPQTPAIPDAGVPEVAPEPPTLPLDASEPLPVLNDAERAAALASLAQEVAGCTRCTELVEARTQTVFGVGPVRPRLCFLGEAPGADEDRQGEPFVGAAGQLLDKIIAAMTLRREDVYILNVLKCRPPGNRNPENAEVANCRPYFERQLEILQPEFICCLGGYAAKTLLDSQLSVGRLRGRLHDYRGTQVLVTYHPSYLLRRPGEKRKTWDDVQILMRAMGLKQPD